MVISLLKVIFNNRNATYSYINNVSTYLIETYFLCTPPVVTVVMLVCRAWVGATSSANYPPAPLAVTASSLTDTFQAGNWSCLVAMVISRWVPPSRSFFFARYLSLPLFLYAGEAALRWCQSKGCWDTPPMPVVVRSEVKVTVIVCFPHPAFT